MPIIPENVGEELHAPVVFSDYLLNDDGTLNVERIVMFRAMCHEMAEALSSLLAMASDQPKRTLLSEPTRSWHFLLDEKDHIVSPEQFNDRRLGDPKVLRNRIHAGMQSIRKTTGDPWYAKVETRETRDGRWHFVVRAYLKGTTDTDSQEDEDQPNSPE